MLFYYHYSYNFISYPQWHDFLTFFIWSKYTNTEHVFYIPPHPKTVFLSGLHLLFGSYVIHKSNLKHWPMFSLQYSWHQCQFSLADELAITYWWSCYSWKKCYNNTESDINSCKRQASYFTTAPRYSLKRVQIYVLLYRIKQSSWGSTNTLLCSIKLFCWGSRNALLERFNLSFRGSRSHSVEEFISLLLKS